MLPNQNFRRVFQQRAIYALLTLSLLLITLSALAPDLLARAGGGEGFSSGSSGGGSGGSGGGDDGAIIYLIYLLIRLLIVLCVEYPLFGIPLTLVIVGLVIYAFIQSQKHVQGNTLRKGLNAINANAHADAIQTLTQADPGFDPERFSDRVKSAFVKLQEGWSMQNVAAIRPFVSDGVLERFALQFQEQKDEGYRNQMSDISIAGAKLADASIGPVFQSATLMISAVAVDTRVDLKTGKRISGDSSSQPFCEYWTFVRRPGAVKNFDDPSKPGLMEGRCPNCGNPIVDDASAPDAGAAYKCTACGSALLSGSHDWVLAEITQTNAISASATTPDPESIVQYQATKDPGFSTANLEDRASVIFWRWAKALRIGKPKPLQKVADENFCDEVAALVKKHSDPASDTRRFPGHCAVGSVQALGIIPGEEFDRALVIVEWSGAMLATPIKPVAQPKPPKPVPGGGLYCTSLFTLSRKSGVTTNPALGLSSAHCPSCGGPESDNTADSCPFCGSILNDGSTGWVITHMDDSFSPDSRALIAQLDNHSPEDAYALDPGHNPRTMALWLATAILADDKVTDRERDLFIAFCARQGIDAEQSEAILDTAHREKLEGKSSVAQPDSPRQAQEWLSFLAITIHSVGTITTDDKHLLLTAAHRLGLTSHDARQINANARAEALNRARKAIKQQKQNQ